MRLQQFASALSCAAAFSKYPEWKVSPTRTGSFDDGIQTMNRRARLTRAASLAAFVVGSLLAAEAQVPEKGLHRSAGLRKTYEHTLTVPNFMWRWAWRFGTETTSAMPSKPFSAQ